MAAFDIVDMDLLIKRLVILGLQIDVVKLIEIYVKTMVWSGFHSLFKVGVTIKIFIYKFFTSNCYFKTLYNMSESLFLGFLKEDLFYFH